MAKKSVDSTKRKSGKELRKEYRGLLDRTKALRNRIVKRAEELIEQYPDVVYSVNDFPVHRTVTVGDYKKYWRMDVNAAMNAIDKIEAHIESLQPYKQAEIDWGSPVEVVPEEKTNINAAFGVAKQIAENSTYGAYPKKDNDE